MAKKILIIMFTILLLLASINFVYADIIDPSKYTPSNPSEGEVKPILKFGEKIIGVIYVVGNIVSVGSIIVIGIRYMFSSVEEKAEYKERLFPYFIGACILFAATNIVNFFYTNV